jgi:hypothetical protein
MTRLDLDDNDLHVLNDALVQMPFGRVAGLIGKINSQITAQAEPTAPDQTADQHPDGNAAVNKDAYLDAHPPARP